MCTVEATKDKDLEELRSIRVPITRINPDYDGDNIGDDDDNIDIFEQPVGRTGHKIGSLLEKYTNNMQESFRNDFISDLKDLTTYAKGRRNNECGFRNKVAGKICKKPHETRKKHCHLHHGSELARKRRATKRGEHDGDDKQAEKCSKKQAQQRANRHQVINTNRKDDTDDEHLLA